MTAFRVPSDLAALDLTLREVQTIIKNRQRRAVLQTRLDNLPKKADALREEIAHLEAEEKEAMTKQEETP